MHLLDDIDLIKRIDTKNVYDQIIHYPQCVMIANEHIPFTQRKPFKNDEFKSIVFINKNKCNTTRVFREVLKGEIEVINTDNFNANCLRKNTLVIYIDFDKESIIRDDFLATMEESKADVVMISSEVNKLDFEVNGFFFTTPNIPALLFPYLYTLVIKLLVMVKVLREEDKIIDKIVAALITKAGAITRNQPFDLNLAKHYAHYIHGRIPLIYYTQKLYRPLAGRLKNQINRISKYPAFYSSYENMQMYEMGVWERELLNENYIPIIISKLCFTTPERDDFKELLTQKGVNFLDIYGEHDNPLVDFAGLVYFVDMISFYLAMLGQNDPIES
jgi:hypothetical protein